MNLSFILVSIATLCLAVPLASPDGGPVPIANDTLLVFNLPATNTTLANVKATLDEEPILSKKELWAETDTLLFKTPMWLFLSHRLISSPSYLIWTSEGCTKAPDKPLGFNLKPSCQRHDFGYHNYRDQDRLGGQGRLDIDDNFRRDMKDECMNYNALRRVFCFPIADAYYIAVRIFGGKDDIKPHDNND